MNPLLDAIICGASFLLAFIIFINQNNTKANKWFGTFIFCVFLILFDNVITNTGLLKDAVLLELITISNFIVAPVFYLSICYYIEPVREWKIIDYFHFIFAFLILVLLSFSIIIDAHSEPEDVSPEILEIATIVFNFIFASYVFIYCFLAYKKILKHQSNLRLLNSTFENIDLKWLQNSTTGVIIITVFWLLDILFKISDENKTFNTISSAIYFFGILYITYHWQKQKEIFPYNQKEKEQIQTIIVETALPKEKRKELLTDEKLEEEKTKLLKLIDAEKPFLDCDISLVKLASSMNISTHSLSYVINKGFDENFYQFINRYRIEEAKKLIADSKMDHLSLLGIGFTVGFNSKTVFNTTFKKITGQTPSKYKEYSTLKTRSDL